MAKVIRYAPTSKFPIKFERLRPGSLFRIHSEPSRGMRYSRDNTVYRRGYDHEGFVAYNVYNKDQACLLMPEDMVHPLKVVRDEQNH